MWHRRAEACSGSREWTEARKSIACASWTRRAGCWESAGSGTEVMADWLERCAGATGARVGVAIEAPRAPVVESLMACGFAVHAINPKQLDRFSPAGAKDDRRDARVLADALPASAGAAGARRGAVAGMDALRGPGALDAPVAGLAVALLPADPGAGRGCRQRLDPRSAGAGADARARSAPAALDGRRGAAAAPRPQAHGGSGAGAPAPAQRGGGGRHRRGGGWPGPHPRQAAGDPPRPRRDGRTHGLLDAQAEPADGGAEEAGFAAEQSARDAAVQRTAVR